MPRLEPKQVQKDLDAGILWPVYWLYGQERMKSRELLKRIRRAALGENAGSAAVFGEEYLDGSEVSAAEVADSANSLSLGGGLRFLVIRDAHAIKEPEELESLLTAAGKKESLSSVCVFLSKDLDGRKKFSKTLTEKAAVVPCEEIPEEEREAWIQYLLKRRSLTMSPEGVAQLRALDPWSLDILDQELEKYELATLDSGKDPTAVLLESLGSAQNTTVFLDAFFARQKKQALETLSQFADSPDQTLPLLGLLGWNARFLALTISDRDRRTRFVKLSPFLAERFNRWARSWSLPEALDLQSALSDVDFDTKQTGRLPLGTWSNLVQQFGR